MGLLLKEVVPWGRSLAEYEAMFALGEGERSLRVLGCGDGPASFNAGWTQRGGQAVSVDPLYVFSEEAIRARIAETFATVMAQMALNREHYRWQEIASVEALGRLRQAAMADFLEDFPQGLRAGRYVAAGLPDLPFADDAFDLALCSHFLFLYSGHHNLAFHVRALREMLRLAPEVRVFPLLTLDGVLSPHVVPVMELLAGEGIGCERVRVAYEFQRGGDEMLKLTRQAGKKP